MKVSDRCRHLKRVARQRCIFNRVFREYVIKDIKEGVLLAIDRMNRTAIKESLARFKFNS